MIFIAYKNNNQVDVIGKLVDFFKGAKDGKWKIEITKWLNTRTLKQNNYLWLYYGIIAKETGDNVNDLHEYLKRKLLPPRFVTVLSKEVKLPASTRKLSKEEFSDYITQIEVLTGVPAPDTEGYL